MGLIPAMTRSTAYSKLNVWTDVCPSRAACSAASLQMLAMSAPVNTNHRQGWGVVLALPCQHLGKGKRRKEGNSAFNEEKQRKRARSGAWAYESITGEAEARGLQVLGKYRLHSGTLSQNNKGTRRKGGRAKGWKERKGREMGGRKKERRRERKGGEGNKQS